MKEKLRKILRFLPPFLWMALIFYFSSRQKIAVSSSYWVSFFIFKTLHLIEYGILFLLWIWAFEGRKIKVKTALILSFLYAVFDEVHQKFVPTREGKLRDIFIDALGIFLSWRLAFPFLFSKKVVTRK